MSKEQFEFQKDKHRLAIEYFRFFATLSTGSIVILTSFLERLQAQPSLRFLVGVAFAGFMACIVATIVAYTSIVENFGNADNWPEAKKFAFAVPIVWLSFIIAITALTIFGWVNLFNPPGIR